MDRIYRMNRIKERENLESLVNPIYGMFTPL